VRALPLPARALPVPAGAFVLHFVDMLNCGAFPKPMHSLSLSEYIGVQYFIDRKGQEKDDES